MFQIKSQILNIFIKLNKLIFNNFIMRKKETEIKYLKEKELKKIFSSIEKTKNNNKYYLRDLTIFNLAYYCWLRISEIWLIKREDYNSDTWEIYIRRLKWSNNNTIMLDKVRLNLLKKYIREYKIDDDKLFLFQTKSWKIVWKATIEYLVNKYKKISWLKHFHFHMLKHSIAVKLLEIWLSIFELKHHLWHKNIDSTMVYSSFSSKMYKTLYEKIDKIGV